MKNQWNVVGWCLVLMMVFPVASALGKVGWKIDRTLKFAQPIKGMAASRDGRWVFVLTTSGRVAVYTADGILSDTLSLGDHIDRIAAGPGEDQLLVYSSKDHGVKMISLEFRHPLPIGLSPVRGDRAAPVTITIFADFQCPFCNQVRPLLDQVLEKNKGKVKLVFKNFPLKMHPYALDAALASEVAAKAGKFWDFHDLLFDNQRDLSPGKILDIAVDLGFDRASFEKQMKAPDNYKRIQADIAEGLKAGVKGVPTIFINGRQLKQRTLEGFQTMIDAALASKKDTP